jgi:hypothetical protein
MLINNRFIKKNKYKTRNLKLIEIHTSIMLKIERCQNSIKMQIKKGKKDNLNRNSQ